MTPAQASAIERASPGDRGPLLRALAARHETSRDALLASGPLSIGRRAALTHAESALRKIRHLARRFDVALDREDIEFAPGKLTGAQRTALTAALADPAFCRALADHALSQFERAA